MTDLARTFQVNENIDELPVKAAELIERGDFVSDDAAGFMETIVGASGNNFVGIATEAADNSAGVAGSKSVKLKQAGKIVEDVVGATGVTDLLAAVYTVDGKTLQLDGTGAVNVGFVARYISGTKCVVYFNALTPNV